MPDHDTGTAIPAVASGPSDPEPHSAPAPLIALQRIADGGFAEVEAVVDGDAESLILHRRGGQVLAWLNVCPHAGRRLDWAPGHFLTDKDGHLVCAAHGAVFELTGGQCVAGPCRGDRLRAVAVVVVNGSVLLAQPPATVLSDDPRSP